MKTFNEFITESFDFKKWGGYDFISVQPFVKKMITSGDVSELDSVYQNHKKIDPETLKGIATSMIVNRNLIPPEDKKQFDSLRTKFEEFA